MTRSVEELRRESERSRVQLAGSVDDLRERITNTAEDMRHKVSPQHLKSEISDFISQETQSWAASLKQQAMQNPMQAMAAGAIVAAPLMRMARAFPLPLLMIGAGLALGSKTFRDQVAEAAAPGIDRAREMMDEATERTQSLRRDASEAVSSVRRQANGLVGDAQDAAQGTMDNLRNRAAQTADTVTDTVRSGMAGASEKANDTMERARSAANRARYRISDVATTTSDIVAAAPERARQVIGENAALIGGLGIAIGAILAASLPETKAEASVMGSAAESMKRTAGSALQSGFEEIKEKAMSVAAKSLADTDTASHPSHPTESMPESLKVVADGVGTAAVNPSHNSNI
jgi:ElaB/YqjD/DUF883 family membrane-anchored ribosome-binding protein